MSTIERLKRRLVHHLAKPGDLPRLIWKNATWPLSPMAAEHRFDRSFGIDTAGIIEPDQLDLTPELTKDAAPYQASPIRITRHIIRKIASRVPGATFIDVGSGKGRVLLIAAEFGFSRVIGIELSSRLSAIALDNVARYRRGRPLVAPITVLNMNATEFDAPPGPCVFFFFMPFKESVMREILGKLVQSIEKEPRKIILVYSSIDQGDLEKLNGGLFDRDTFDLEHVRDLPRDRSARPGFSVIILESKAETADRN